MYIQKGLYQAANGVRGVFLVNKGKDAINGVRGVFLVNKGKDAINSVRGVFLVNKGKDAINSVKCIFCNDFCSHENVQVLMVRKLRILITSGS